MLALALFTRQSIQRIILHIKFVSFFLHSLEIQCLTEKPFHIGDKSGIIGSCKKTTSPSQGLLIGKYGQERKRITSNSNTFVYQVETARRLTEKDSFKMVKIKQIDDEEKEKVDFRAMN